MLVQKLSREWFKKWEEGSFLDLPITNDFLHKSPFGIIKGKDNYLELISNNKDKFLGYKFEIIDEIYLANTGCIRYKATQNEFLLDVCEWHYIENDLIKKIVSYYHIGEIQKGRQISNYE